MRSMVMLAVVVAVCISGCVDTESVSIVGFSSGSQPIRIAEVSLSPEHFNSNWEPSDSDHYTTTATGIEKTSYLSQGNNSALISLDNGYYSFTQHIYRYNTKEEAVAAYQRLVSARTNPIAPRGALDGVFIDSIENNMGDQSITIFTLDERYWAKNVNAHIITIDQNIKVETTCSTSKGHISNKDIDNVLAVASIYANFTDQRLKERHPEIYLYYDEG